MKKNYLLCVLVFLSLLMGSCNNNSGYYLIAGEFYSKENGYSEEYTDCNEDYQDAILRIKEIDKSTYLQANGVNVVKDISSDRIGDYYSIELLVFSKEKNDYVQLNYYNLKREPHMHAISYRDENDYLLAPHEFKNHPNSPRKYTASHQGYRGVFYLKEI
ncbi:MAG: hypothetical protein K2I42_02175 [Anaeroplasmataceae bacterium]|nr:hypothetical protein [Anaeroplasmataceae bacterium]